MDPVRRKRVLVAEDEPHILRLLQLQLERNGCDTVVARDGQEALELIKAGPYDLIVLDVMMPYVDGLSVLKAIRSNPSTESVFVAVLTVKAQNQDVSEGYSAGADLYMTKPFEPADIQMLLDCAFREG